MAERVGVGFGIVVRCVYEANVLDFGETHG